MGSRCADANRRSSGTPRALAHELCRGRRGPCELRWARPDLGRGFCNSVFIFRFDLHLENEV